MFKLKQIFCKHDYEVCRPISRYSSLDGEQLYLRCKKCHKVKKYIYRKFEGFGYK